MPFWAEQLVATGGRRQAEENLVDVSRLPADQRGRIWTRLQTHDPELARVITQARETFGRYRLLLDRATVEELLKERAHEL